MKTLRVMAFFVLTVALVMTSLPASSQVEEQQLSCPELVRRALDATQIVCSELGSNQACYGHILVDVRPREGIEELLFTTEGDLANLLDVQSLRLSSMDLNTNSWGVALMNLEAHMQYAEPEDVTLLLYGDVEISDQGESPTVLSVTVAVRGYVNVRVSPSTSAGVLGVLQGGQTVLANGRREDSSWIRVILPDTGRVGWISASLVTSDEDLQELHVVDAWAPYYGPMQAFYLESGSDDSLCAQAPESGLLVQTPEGVAEVTLLVNEVSIQLNATAFVQAQAGNQMTVEVLDGWAQVESFGRTQTVVAGTQVSIPLNEDLAPTGEPGELVPGGTVNRDAFPVSLLDHEVAVSDVLTPDQIAAILDYLTSVAVAGDESTIDGSGTTGGESDEPPDGLPKGLLDNGVLPPGHGGTPPGQGGTPPGQDK
jgi:uncharacterized protein YgiM (DUF1202 family)